MIWIGIFLGDRVPHQIDTVTLYIALKQTWGINRPGGEKITVNGITHNISAISGGNGIDVAFELSGLALIRIQSRLTWPPLAGCFSRKWISKVWLYPNQRR